jgi:hypothetical protein
VELCTRSPTTAVVGAAKELPVAAHTRRSLLRRRKPVMNPARLSLSSSYIVESAPVSLVQTLGLHASHPVGGAPRAPRTKC